MAIWTPDQKYKDSDVYIIGGGPSLKESDHFRNFEMSLLIPKITIGCNGVFFEGAHICNDCFFSDYAWFDYMIRSHLADMEQFIHSGGQFFTHKSEFRKSTYEWVNYIPRGTSGLYRDKIAYNRNSGASAINLALIRGAKRVFLLGFDCELGSKGQMNYHNWRSDDKVNSDAFNGFLEGFNDLFRCLPEVFPGTEVINLNPNSKIETFPKKDWQQFL